MKPALVEVYPHVSLLNLSGSRTRLPYKAAKTTGYWPNTARDERRRRVRDQWQLILDKLGNDIDDVPQAFDISSAFETTTLNALKPFEDALDAMVCAWSGYRYSIGKAMPYGDATAAIWVPTS